MNRGQNWGVGWLKSVLGAMRCAGVLCAALAGVASATNAMQRAAPQPDRSWENYFGIAILPSGRAIVVGDKGVVMTTDDGGRTWTREPLRKGDKYYDLYSVAFTSEGLRGWIVGDNGVIFRTDDRGATWSEQKAPPGASGALLKIAVGDAQKACAGGEHGVILCTSDGGANWNLQKFDDIGFFDVVFTDPDNAWAVGEFATLLHSSDGGKNWKVQNGGEMGKGDPYFALAFDGHAGLAVGLIGDALETSDGGKTWRARQLPIEHRSLYAVAAVPARAGEFYAAGENGIAALIVGDQVTQVPSGVADAISAATFSPRFAMAVGLSGTLLRSDDGGRHWHSLIHKEQALQTQTQ